MKKIFSLIVSLLILSICFLGCESGHTNENASFNSSENGDIIINTADVSYFDGVEAVYSIVRPAESKNNEATVAGLLFKQFKAKLGISLKNISDENDGTDKYEILIGATNRAESQQALDHLKSKTGGRYNDYIICTIGKKIVINAYNAEVLSNAADYFLDNYVKSKGVDGGIEFCYAVQGDFEIITINGVNISEYIFVKPQYNTSYLTQLEMENLREHIYNKTGYMLNIARENDEQSEYEIIVGNPERDGVELILDHDAYRIVVSGKRVYLNGGSPHATAMAVSEFAKSVAGDIKDFTVNGSYSTSIGQYDLETKLHYVWGDEFDNGELDTEKWLQRDENMQNQGLNGKISVRSSDPNDVFIKDGKFYICAREDENYYYGGLINTQNRMCFRFGYAEVSAVVPHGGGFWVAFWATNAGLMSDRSDPGTPPYYTPEYDIMEMFGNSSYYAANMHANPTDYGKSFGLEHYSLDVPQYVNAKKYFCPDGGLLSQDFHTYGLLWSEDRVGFTCDGIEYFSYDTTENEFDKDCFNRHVNLIFSLATGFANCPEGKITDNPNDWQNTNKLIADYINLYQCDDGKSNLILGSTVEM
ncbi:MAG: glycoside hydrolase family 16 protein [Clostridia bacterium]|nr:glycoside hydrolase family 16 protein [Clostridia bacterium]